MLLSVRATIAYLFCVGGLLAAPSFAQDDPMQAAITAYEAGEFNKAGQLWEPLASAGNAQAQYAMAVLYHKGQGRPADFGRALDWYRKAAGQDHVNSLFNLGVAYWEGRGVDRDLKQAVKWWRRAAELEYGAAQHNLATAYYLGQGVDKDVEQSVKWFQKAAANGYSRAEKALTVIQDKFPEMFASAEPEPAQSSDTPATPAMASAAEPPAGDVAAAEPMEPTPPQASTDAAAPAQAPTEAVSEAADQTARMSPVPESAPAQMPEPAQAPPAATTASGAGQPLAGRVGPGGAKVYPFHRESLPMLEELTPNSPVRVVLRENDWLYVQVPGGLPMWVYGRYLDGDSGSATVIAPDVRARPLPSTASHSYPLGSFNHGDTVEVLEVQGDWKRVRGPERLGAWVRAQDILLGSIAQAEMSPSSSAAAASAASAGSIQVSRIGEGGAKIYPYYRESLPVMAELSPDSEVRLVLRQGDWLYVQVPGGLDVWVYGRYVDGDDGPGIINAADVRARPLPSTARNSYPLGTFEQGETVEVLEVQGQWKRVRAPERLGAWVKASDVVAPQNRES